MGRNVVVGEYRDTDAINKNKVPVGLTISSKHVDCSSLLSEDVLDSFSLSCANFFVLL